MNNSIGRSIAALSILVSVVSFGMEPTTELSRLQQNGQFGAFSPVLVSSAVLPKVSVNNAQRAAHRSNIVLGYHSAYLNGITSATGFKHHSSYLNGVPSINSAPALNMLADVLMASDKSMHGSPTK